jgi:hypothetical protein
MVRPFRAQVATSDRIPGHCLGLICGWPFGWQTMMPEKRLQPRSVALLGIVPQIPPNKSAVSRTNEQGTARSSHDNPWSDLGDFIGYLKSLLIRHTRPRLNLIKRTMDTLHVLRTVLGKKRTGPSLFRKIGFRSLCNGLSALYRGIAFLPRRRVTRPMRDAGEAPKKLPLTLIQVR